ncbi:MAG: hypothetical protein QW416_07865 [Candidatus Nitrosocaldaceae archaeon]
MVDESIILKLQIDDGASTHIEKINSHFAKLNDRIKSIDNNVKALGIITVFKNTTDILEKGNNAMLRYEKGLLEIKKKEEELTNQKKELQELQIKLNEAHDPAVLEKYEELQSKIKITEEELAIKKKELNSDLINMIQTYTQLGGSTIPLLIANLGRLSSILTVVRGALISTFITNPVGLAIMGITGTVLALNEAFGFLPFKISDALKPMKSLNDVKMDTLAVEVKKVSTELDDIGKKAYDASKKFEELSKNFMDVTGLGDLGKEFERMVGKDITKRVVISKPEVLIGQVLDSPEFIRVLAMHKAGIIPERTITSNMLELLKRHGLPTGLVDDTKLKLEIMLRERLNSLSDEHNRDLTDQVSIYSKLKIEVIDTNMALSKFMNQIIMLRRQLETEIERIRSMPLSISIPSGSSSLSSKIQSNPNNPKNPSAINNIGSRQMIGQFTSGIYTY